MTHSKPGSYGEILNISIPLVISTGSWTLMHFTDRMFLSWFSEEALSASLPAGVANFALICFFMGTATYTGTFVAQYFGAGKFHKIGPIVWQGAFFAFFSGLLLLSMIPLADPLFRLIGHHGNIPALEASYFRILCCGVTFALLSGVFSSFFTGLGKTRVVMIVNIAASGFNIVLDYAWIFGKWGLPRWGLQGAAWATVISAVLSSVVFFILYLLPGNRKNFATASGFGFHGKLFKRLLRYGAPNGVQFFLDMSAFTLFVLLVGRLGRRELAGSIIAFNVNIFAFMPMVGFSIATGILVGQYLGKNRPDIASLCVKRIFILTITYMSVVILTYLFLPGIYVRLYGPRQNPNVMKEVRELAVVLLRFVAFYSFFDAVNLIFSSAIRGAGDTRFVMKVAVICSLFIVVIPSFLCCVVYRGSIYVAWGFFTLYIMTMAVIFFLRYRGGKWKGMRVIEMPVPELSPAPGSLSESEVLR